MTGQFPLGATVTKTGVRFGVWSGAAERMWVSLFDENGGAETARHEMARGGDGLFALEVASLRKGARYGFRADGPYEPDAGFWFDPDKLLVDPYAIELDRPFRYDPILAAKRGEGSDTASLMPKAVVTLWRPAKRQAPIFKPGGFVYELNVRSFTMRHPDVPEQRGTIAALAHPAVIAHLKHLAVDAVELMPVTAWIDERHLGPLGLTNAWGYNPVTFMALDPRLAPGGVAELHDTVAALRKAGIGTILDLVFNHTGESDAQGPTLSLRGLDNRAYYRHVRDRLANDTGTGNTVACDHPRVVQMVLDSLRHFVVNAGVDGFRFDLAPVLGRGEHGYDPDAPILKALRDDPVLADRVMIAEPWDIGAGGYQLGNFRPPTLEWNDQYRDDIRRFWRGDRSMVADLATRLAGSSDVFASDGAVQTRTVNFIAAHDGFALTDIVAYERKHNEANGEDNRDGHGENLSWNNGVEGATDYTNVEVSRRRDVRALLATLFASRGTIMLTAGDEFGRTQRGNNNAYAQDNEITWVDWENRDARLEDYVAALAKSRRTFAKLSETEFLTAADVAWLTEAGAPMTDADWHDAERRRLTMVLNGHEGVRLAVMLNGDRHATEFALPQADGYAWERMELGKHAPSGDDEMMVAGRTVAFAVARWTRESDV